MTIVKVCVSYLIFVILCITLYIIPVHAEDIIQGNYCYTYGDKESLLEAKQLTRTLAIRNAIESYRVFINSTTNVSNFVLTNDIVQMISSGYMKNITTISQSVDGRTVCEKVQATVSAQAIEEAIKREVTKRTEKIEDQGIDNNGTIKILNIRADVIKEYTSLPSEEVIAVTVKALKNMSRYYSDKNLDTEERTIFIDYYDKDGNAIDGDKTWIALEYSNEIKTIYFRKIPNGTTSYKVWLKKPSKLIRPENKSTSKQSITKQASTYESIGIKTNTFISSMRECKDKCTSMFNRGELKVPIETCIQTLCN